MTLYSRILVPTDGSTEGEQAVAHALDVAAVHDAAVHALYVVDTASYAGMPMESTWDGIGDLLRSDAESALARVEEIATAASVNVETAVVEGSPSREIVRYAEQSDCDLIVMGTHGRGGIDRLLLGSVAEKVVRSASVPVLTVRLDSAATDDHAADPTAPTEATASVDTTEPPDATDRSDSSDEDRQASHFQGDATDTGDGSSVTGQS